MASDDRAEIACERLHPEVANWRCRPIPVIDDLDWGSENQSLKLSDGFR
jgi:hypothetical protein